MMLDTTLLRSIEVTPTQWQLMTRLFLPWTLLCMIGVVMVGSASIATASDHLTKHVIYLLAGGAGLLIAVYIPTVVLQKLSWVAWALAMIVCVAVLVPGVGYEVNGARRWLRISGFSVQAAEVAKLGVGVFMAAYLARHRQQLATSPAALLLPIGLSMLICMLLVAEPDLGSAVVIFTAVAGLAYVAGAKLRYFLALVLLGAAAVYMLIELAPYRMARMVAFLDPWAVAFGSGYQLTQALIAFGRGELWGLGLGESIQKLFYLPEAHNDFIFAVIAEELGAVGVIAVALLFTWLVVQIFNFGKQCGERQHLFAAYFTYFTGLVFALQFLINLGVNTGALPTKGLTLPFVSYGGNSLMVSCVMLGIVVRCVIESDQPRRTRRRT